MVKIRNLFGDRYKGRQGNAVYQGRYGKQIRRTWNDRKKNRSPAQEEQKARFRQAHAWVRTLSTEEIEGLKRFTAEHYPSLTWQQYAIKTALDRGKVSVTTHEVSTLKETWRSDWDAPGWPYREDITLTNNMAEDLTDYQKLLELDETKVGPNFRWDLGGKDLRFYDENGQKIPYWVEEWNEENKTAKVWVKVGLIPAGGTAKIKMYYGNAQAESESDGEAVFDFYDDFNRSELGDGYYTRAGTGYSVHDSVLDMSKDTTMQIESTAKFNGYNDKLILEQKIRNRNTRLVGWARWDGSSYFHEWAGFGDRPDNRFRIETNNDGWGTKYNLNDAQWKILRLEWTDTMMRLSALNLDYTQITSLTKTQSDGNGIQQGDLQFVWYVYSGDSSQILEVDWIRVRKYAEQEPATEFGAEEYGKITTGVIQVRTTVTVSHSGLEAVEVYDDQGNLLVRADGLSDLKSGEVTQVWEWHIDKDQAQPIGRVVYWSISGVKNEWTPGGT